MDIQNLYSEKVMDHFKNPRNMGEIKDPSGVATVGNPTCVLPQTIIMANSEAVSISKIQIGKKVLSHDGFYHKVIKIHKKSHEGELYRLRIHNLGEVFITPEHYVYSSHASSYTHKYVAFKKNKFVLDWNKVEELEKGDFIAYPVPKETTDVKEITFSVLMPKWDFKSKPLPEKIPINKDFLRLVGYYLAEGYSRIAPSKGMVGFVFRGTEEEYVKDTVDLMKNIFSIAPTNIRKQHNALQVNFFSARLARFFNGYFGKGAGEKHLPHFMMSLPTEKQKEILCGLWRGDGYINESKKVSKFVTISSQLAYQMRILLLRQEIVFSFLVSPSKGIHKKSYCFYVKDQNSLIKIGKIVGRKIKFPKKVKNSAKSWYANGLFYTPIWQKEKINYKGDVLNLEVEGAHSYLVEAAALHNCGDIMRMYIKVGQRPSFAPSVVEGASEGKEEFIEDAKFQTLGCGAAIATSSMATEMIIGKSLDEALTLSNKAVAEALGGLPPVKMHCSVLAEEAISKAIENYKQKK